MFAADGAADADGADDAAGGVVGEADGHIVECAEATLATTAVATSVVLQVPIARAMDVRFVIESL